MIPEASKIHKVRVGKIQISKNSENVSVQLKMRLLRLTEAQLRTVAEIVIFRWRILLV